MIGRRTAIGMALLCALVFSAFAAQSAWAVKGTTLFTCAPVEVGAKFKDAHCKEAGEGKGFVHQEITKKTIFHATNAKTTDNTAGNTPGILSGEAFGVKVEIECGNVLGHGELENKLEGKEHYFANVETADKKQVTIHYTNCVVKGKETTCEVENKTVLVEGVTATTKGQEDNVRFNPPASGVFVVIKIKAVAGKLCLVAGNHEVTGSVRGQATGATLTFVEATITAENTLKFAGNPAGLSGRVTISQAGTTPVLGKEPGATGNPLSATTIETV
jgi:hypothetical protein